MKRIILLALSIVVVGTFAIAQAQEDTSVHDCDNCETVDEECSCGGTVDGCTDNCDTCDEHDDTAGCEDEECDCETPCDDCTCDDSSSEEVVEEEIQHCGGGCH
ncbi:MAG: hypothetical protein ABFR50_07995 [Candidatus Fermentibacteria bacterium]